MRKRPKMTPWSPIPHLKDALRILKTQGHTEQVDVGTLRRELVRQTGSTTPESLNNYMRLMEDFHLIKSAHNENGQVLIGLFQICPEDEWEL